MSRGPVRGPAAGGLGGSEIPLFYPLPRLLLLPSRPPRWPWEVGGAGGRGEGCGLEPGRGPSVEARAAGPAPASHIWAGALAHPAAPAARPSGLGEGEGKGEGSGVAGRRAGPGAGRTSEGCGRRGRGLATPPAAGPASRRLHRVRLSGGQR